MFRFGKSGIGFKSVSDPFLDFLQDFCPFWFCVRKSWNFYDSALPGCKVLALAACDPSCFAFDFCRAIPFPKTSLSGLNIYKYDSQSLSSFSCHQRGGAVYRFISFASAADFLAWRIRCIDPDRVHYVL